MNEAELQEGVLDTAQALSWLRAHFRPARTKDGWRTAVAGDGKGFPDLVLLRQGRMIVAELKGDDGSLAYEQQLWLTAFSIVANVEVHVWTPADWTSGAIEAALR